MNARKSCRAARVALGAAVLVVAAMLAAPAMALPSGPPIAVGAADYAAGTVHVSVAASAGLSAVHFEDADGATLDVVAHPASPSAGFDVALSADTTIVAVGYDALAHPKWQSSVPLELANYLPGRPWLDLADDTLVGSEFAAVGHAPGSTVTTMTVIVRGAEVWSGSATLADGAFSLPAVSVPYGPSYVGVRVSNGFGQATTPAVRVYNLATTLKDRRFILVDKSELTLYYIFDRRVKYIWPCAIGTPATPTHIGIFKLGPWVHTPNSVWGPRRMPLLRRVHKRYVGTGYYIHGTNDPSSIGTMASHGCVRLYNRNAILLSHISRWFPVQIRR